MSNFIIAHVPHASSVLPDRHAYSGNVEAEIALVTDWYTDRMINADESIIFPYSRVWCDVERFPNDPLAERGLGMYYTHRLNGERMRDMDNATFLRVEASYQKHHSKLVETIASAICDRPVCLLDVHSYSDVQVELCVLLDRALTFAWDLKKVLFRRR